MAPPSNENANYLAHLKVQSLLKKTLKTASKSTQKQRHKTCSKYTPSNERCVGLGAWQKSQPQSVTKKTNIQTPYFRTYSRHAFMIFPKLSMVIEHVVPILKGCNHFSIQRIVFPTGCTEIFGLIDQCAVSQKQLRNLWSESCQIWKTNAG